MQAGPKLVAGSGDVVGGNFLLMLCGSAECVVSLFKNKINQCKDVQSTTSPSMHAHMHMHICICTYAYAHVVGKDSHCSHKWGFTANDCEVTYVVHRQVRPVRGGW